MAEYLIEVRKLTMQELFLIREKTGRSVLAAIMTKKLDEQMQAALLWVAKRRQNPAVTFEEVFEASWSDDAIVLDLNDSAPPLENPGSMTRTRSRKSAGSITSPLAI